MQPEIKSILTLTQSALLSIHLGPHSNSVLSDQM